MRLIILLLIIFSELVSCKKEKADINYFWQCSMSQNLDSQAISNKLAGSWTWTKQSCFWTNIIKSADRNIKVSFDSNATFSVYENSNTLKQGTWKLKQVDGNIVGLDLFSPSEYLYGHIFFAIIRCCSTIATGTAVTICS
jgi:hypothetical protein